MFDAGNKSKEKAANKECENYTTNARENGFGEDFKPLWRKCTNHAATKFIEKFRE